MPLPLLELARQTIDWHLSGRDLSDPLLYPREMPPQACFVSLKLKQNKLAAAAKIGGCIGGANADQQESLYAFGNDLGIAFQIVDDALDYVPQREHVGKPHPGAPRTCV